jgi:hypothetical protein
MSMLAFPILVAATWLQAQSFDSELRDQRYLKVEYCDLLKSPAAYDGKRVSFKATYRYGFEWQEVYCVKCRNSAKTWLEFPSERSKQIEKAGRGTPKGQGTFNGLFSGVFHSGGGFGDGGYKFELELQAIEGVEVVSRSGGVPDVLKASERKKLCQ